MAETKLCEKCGSALPEGAKFCVVCGAPIREHDGTVCPHCSAPVVPGSSFCVHCGASLTAQPETEANVNAAQPETQAEAEPDAARPSVTAPEAEQNAERDGSAEAGDARTEEEKGVLCPNCGAPACHGQPFCTNCGAKLDGPHPAPEPEPEAERKSGAEAGEARKEEEKSVLCPSCGAPVRTVLSFCTRCGTKLGDSSHAPTPLESAPVMLGLGKKKIPVKVPPFLLTKKGKLAAAGAGAACVALIAVLVFAFGGSSADAHYKKACEAMSEIGMMNWNPLEGMDFDFKKQWRKVEKELKAAADKGTPDMKCDYVRFLLDHTAGEPDGFVINKKEAENYLKKAASEGSVRAKFYLGSFDILESADERQRFMMEACESGNPYALHNVAMNYFYATGDIAGALDTLIQAAENLDTNDPEATPFMNELHSVEYKTNPFEEVDWPVDIGAIYELGLAGKRDLSEALKWYEKAGKITNSLRNPGMCMFFSVASGDDADQFDNIKAAINRVKSKMR